MQSNIDYMISGDVESNPDPMNKVEADAFAQALNTITKLGKDLAAL